MLLDSLDGRVARMTSTQTEFGAELDSLSDLVSFGLAPALLLYYSMLHVLGRLGWLVCFIFAACVALRLARFNSQDENINHRYFRGLSSPIAAGVVIAYVLILAQYDCLSQSWLHYLALIVTPIIALLMVSKLRYRSFKDFNLRRKVPFIVVLLFLLLITLLVYHPAAVLLASLLFYSLSGPFLYLWRMYLAKRIRKKK
jgi:CDP-diacylglycerol---serine O-phosphatidyltransferase